MCTCSGTKIKKREFTIKVGTIPRKSALLTTPGSITDCPTGVRNVKTNVMLTMLIPMLCTLRFCDLPGNYYIQLLFKYPSKLMMSI